MVFIGLISTSLQPLSPTSWLPSTPQPFPCRVRAKRVVVAVPKKSLVTIILVRSPSNFIFTQSGCLLTAPKRKKLKIPNFIFLTKWGGCPPLRWLNPLKFNPQAARLWYANKTKGTITLKHCAVLEQFTTHSYWEVIRWNVMTFIFIQHSADREGHRERLAEKQGVHSTITSRRKQWGRVHVNCRFFSERTASSSSLRPTTLSLSAVLYSAYTTVRPSRCRRLNAPPPPPPPSHFSSRSWSFSNGMYIQTKND